MAAAQPAKDRRPLSLRSRYGDIPDPVAPLYPPNEQYFGPSKQGRSGGLHAQVAAALLASPLCWPNAHAQERKERALKAAADPTASPPRATMVIGPIVLRPIIY